MNAGVSKRNVNSQTLDAEDAITFKGHVNSKVWLPGSASFDNMFQSESSCLRHTNLL